MAREIGGRPAHTHIHQPARAGVRSDLINVALVLKRIVLVLGLWLFLSAATIRCSSGTFQDDDDKDKPDRNRAPVASNSFLQTVLNQDVSDRMQATDPDGDPLTFRVTAGPDRGSLTRLDDRGFFTYRPAELGSDQFSFRANDGELDSNTAQVVIRSTLTAAGAAGRSKPGRASGLAGIYPDGARPDVLLVHWDGPDGSLESVPGTGAGPIETRLERVAAVAADPWQAGRLVVIQTDGKLLESHDAGRSWAPRGRLAPPGRGAELALSDTRIIIARPAPVCGPGVPVPFVTGKLNATEVCGHAPFVGPDDDAYVLTGEPGNSLLVSLDATVLPSAATDRDRALAAKAAADAHPPGQAPSGAAATGSSTGDSTPTGRILARGVIRAGSDSRRPGRLWAVATGPHGDRLRSSDDAGFHWTTPVPLPSGRGVDALTDAAGSLWVVMVVGDRESLIYRLEQQNWAIVAAVAGRLQRCGERMCLLGPAGRRLWRLPHGGGSVAPLPE